MTREMRLSWPEALLASVESANGGTTTSVSRRSGSNIIKDGAALDGRRVDAVRGGCRG